MPYYVAADVSVNITCRADTATLIQIVSLSDKMPRDIVCLSPTELTFKGFPLYLLTSTFILPPVASKADGPEYDSRSTSVVLLSEKF